MSLVSGFGGSYGSSSPPSPPASPPAFSPEVAVRPPNRGLEPPEPPNEKNGVVVVVLEASVPKPVKVLKIEVDAGVVVVAAGVAVVVDGVNENGLIDVELVVVDDDSELAGVCFPKVKKPEDGAVEAGAAVVVVVVVVSVVGLFAAIIELKLNVGVAIGAVVVTVVVVVGVTFVVVVEREATGDVVDLAAEKKSNLGCILEKRLAPGFTSLEEVLSLASPLFGFMAFPNENVEAPKLGVVLTVSLVSFFVVSPPI